MRTFNKLLTISAIAFLFMLMAPHKSMAQDGGYVSDQEFYDNLQDYGTWVYDEQFGNVWVPDVDGDFRPYATNGYWVQTDYGTTWVSDYPWGWATFHYGRWRYDDYYGWEWIPGHEWAPAWVSWRQGGGYYSWAPMQPGISITISFGGGYHVPDNYWVCAPQAYITSRYINRYYAPPTRVNYIIRNTTNIHNTYVYNHNTYIVGPRARDIEHITHRRVTIYRINNADRPGAARLGSRSINIYRPAVRPNVDARPVRVVDAHAYRQEHPNDRIGRVGVTVNVHTNAAKLSAVARSSRPDNRVVRVNPVPVKPVNDRANPAAQPTHPDLPGGHKSIGPVTPATPAPATENKNPHKVAPAVMPPADHHDPTVRQPANNQAAEQQKQQAQQAEQQKKQEQQQAEQQQKTQEQQQKAQERQQQQQAARQVKQEQQKQQQQAAQQAKQQAQEQQKQQAQQAEQQKKTQEQQQKAQERQQQQQAAQQAKQEQQKQQQQAAQQAKQQAQEQQKQQQQAQQQAAQQQKIQQQQAAQQAKQQAQQAARQQQQQAQQQAKQQAQQAAQQQKMQQQQQAKLQQQAAQKAARDAAKKQQEEQQKQQAPPGN